MSKKTIAITGVGGYIGSALAVRLSKKYRIIGFGRGKNFSELSKKISAGTKLVEGDVANTALLHEALKGADVVIHTASPISNALCEENPWAAVRTIIHGTQEVAAAVHKNSIPLFIHFSTQAVYSNSKPRPMPLRENMELLPDNLYGALKAEAEWQASQIPAIIVRPSNVYGDGGGVGRRASTVIERFVASARFGEELRIEGDATRGIDFIHIRDVTAFVEKLITDPPPNLAIFNVSSGVAISLGELAKLVAAKAKTLLDVHAQIVFTKDETLTSTPTRWLDNTRARDFCPGFPNISLEDGVSELLKLEG